MANLLTPGEILDLTGTPQPKRQVAWLREHGLNPLPRSDGTLAISWEAVNAVMLGRQPPGADALEGQGVNFDALN